MRYVEAINQALYELLSQDEKVILLGEDIIDPYGGAFKATKGLSTHFSDRVITTPISEAGMVGVGTGLALQGYRPIIEIMFGDFITLATDQIVNGISKIQFMYGRKIDLPIVIRIPMGGYRGYGPTHSQSLESLFFNVPNLSILAPSVYHNPGYWLKESVYRTTPTLFVENKVAYAQELKSANPSSSVVCVKNVPDIPEVIFITYGGMADLVVEASMRLLLEKEVVAQTIIPIQIIPAPIADLTPFLHENQRVIVVEEGRGWGNILIGGLQDKLEWPMRCVTGTGTIPASKILERQHLPQVETIMEVAQ